MARAAAVLASWILLQASAAVAQDDDAWMWEEEDSGPSAGASEPESESEADAQDADMDEAAATAAGAATSSDPPKWWFGAFTRMVWVPSAFLKLFVHESPAVLTGAGGVVVNMRTSSNMIVEFGLGYTSYGFAGPFRSKNEPNEEDTEWVDSSLGLVHLTGAILWEAPIHKMVAIEYGLGLDFGIVTGEMIRTEAYRRPDGSYAACAGVLQPPTIGPSGRPYCEDTTPPGLGSNTYDMDGAHYGVKEEGIPPVMAFPWLPRFALRLNPHRQVAIKLEAAYGILQFYFGLSAFGGFDL